MSLIPTSPGNAGTSTRPYLIRALHDWCTDNGFTPYLAVYVDAGVQVPMEYVKNNEIVLNVGFEATTALKLGNELIEFKARFGGTSRDITVPVDHVIAIYARENGQGMAFPVPTESAAGAELPLSSVPTASERPTQPGGLRLATAEGSASGDGKESAADDDHEPPEPPSGGRPSLKRVK
ncbi:MAG: ClpXP protease specificity-enhancing factor [Rhizobacter sp.]